MSVVNVFLYTELYFVYGLALLICALPHPHPPLYSLKINKMSAFRFSSRIRASAQPRTTVDVRVLAARQKAFLSIGVSVVDVTVVLPRRCDESVFTLN